MTPGETSGRRGPARGRIRWNLTLAPGLVLLAVLFVAPLAILVIFSFASIDVLGRPALDFVMTNYDQVFRDYNLPVVLRTVVFALATTLICLVLGYTVAYTAVRFAGRWGAVLIVVVVAPWLVDFLIRIYAWRSVLSESGLAGWIAQSLGLPYLQLLGTPTAVIGGLVYGYLPLMVLPLYAALGQMDQSQIDAGKDLYGRPWSTFLHVTLPATREGAIGGSLLVFLPVLGDFATNQFLGGPDTSMIGTVISTQFVQGGSQPFGAAMTVTLVIGLILAVAVALIASRGRSRLMRVM